MGLIGCIAIAPRLPWPTDAVWEWASRIRSAHSGKTIQADHHNHSLFSASRVCGVEKQSEGQEAEQIATFRIHLKQQLQRKLHDAGRVCRADDSEGTAVHVAVRLPKLSVIERIEELGAELEPG